MSEPLISRKEAARLLDCSTFTVARMTQQGLLPAIRVGGSVKYEPAEIRRFLNENRVGGGGK